MTSASSLRILGIDPGLQVTGFGVIEVQGMAMSYLASGTIRTQAQRSLPERLKVLFEGVREVVERYQPQVCAVEIVFVNNNPQATLMLGQAPPWSAPDKQCVNTRLCSSRKQSPGTGVPAKPRCSKW